ncbi:MAG: cysteine-rich small domain-containing protein [Eubacterium ventriosum]
MDKKEGISKKYWEEKEFSYFSHRKCEFFPCHKNADGNNFNCLFCYCPLYTLGDKCGWRILGIWIMGLRIARDCLYPHFKENYGKVVERFSEIVKSMNEKR